MPHRSRRHDDERAAKKNCEKADAADKRFDEECHEAPFGPDGPATPVGTSHQSTRATSQTPVLPRLVRRVLPETPGPHHFTSFDVRRATFDVRYVRRSAFDGRRRCPRRSTRALVLRSLKNAERRGRGTTERLLTPPLFQDTRPPSPPWLPRLHPRCRSGPPRPPLRAGLSDTPRACDS